ncbi:MAG TPA: AMP-binding protein, partial [Pyrinomonadaceae bacterium]|nr:AMP-binding protein [Pyrinomonadaceae bacterium]
MNLFNAIFSQQSASSLAIVYENARITYGDLQEQILKIAALLNRLGIAPGERVALLLSDSPEFIASFIAICSSKAIAVPINMGLQLEEQRAILNDCTARVGIVEANICSSLQTGVQEGLQKLKQVAVVSRDGQNTSGTRTWNSLKQFGNSQTAGLEIFDLQQSLWESRAAARETFAEPGENEAAFILYTSGSTGEPKGAIHCQSDIFYTNETFCKEVLGL